jgi:hypothetical protein
MEVKMQTFMKYTLQLLVLSCLLVMSGCGGSALPGKKIMEIPPLGISMDIPAGWQLDNPQMCHKGDNTGLIMEEDLGGNTFEKSAARISKEFGNTVVSESRLTINGHEAIKTLIKTSSGDMLLRVYIHKGNKIIWISFAVLKEEYPASESALQQAVQSIKIKS